jgi:hypothetical protein
LADGAVREAPGSLVPGIPSQEFRVAAARDVVVVVPLASGGLISYKRADGTFVHTLNTPDGFARKLAQLGITLGEARSF